MQFIAPSINCVSELSKVMQKQFWKVLQLNKHVEYLCLIYLFEIRTLNNVDNRSKPTERTRIILFITVHKCTAICVYHYFKHFY